MIIPPKQSCTYEAKVDLMHGPDYILDYFIIDLNVISEDELARRVKELRNLGTKQIFKTFAIFAILPKLN